MRRLMPRLTIRYWPAIPKVRYSENHFADTRHSANVWVKAKVKVTVRVRVRVSLRVKLNS